MPHSDMSGRRVCLNVQPGLLRTVLATLLLLVASRLAAQDAYRSPEELKRLTVEQLEDIDVTSVSKYPEPLFDAAAAITVLTGQDIERSGAANIPDALRLVPGMDVAQADAHTWAISSRGFNDIFANKLLVVI